MFAKATLCISLFCIITVVMSACVTSSYDSYDFTLTNGESEFLGGKYTDSYSYGTYTYNATIGLQSVNDCSYTVQWYQIGCDYETSTCVYGEQQYSQFVGKSFSYSGNFLETVLLPSVPSIFSFGAIYPGVTCKSSKCEISAAPYTISYCI